ncbi:unnamed protein product [Rhizophagus irregularis]|nr:unnamed protein product [Rhizophagus irregularis]
MSGVASIPVTTTSTFSDSLPSIENVMKWKRKEVLDFLQENKEVLDIEPSDIKIIEDNRVAGLAFLGLTEQKLVNPPYNLLGGPAGAIANLVKRINDKGQEQPGIDLNSALKNLDDKMDLMRSDFGSVYEASARLEIAKISGSQYSSKFEISDLNGLVRLSLPRKKLSNEKPKFETPIYVQVYRADKVSDYIYNINMKMKLKESINYIRSLPQDNNFIINLNALANRAEKSLNVWEAYQEKHSSSENRLFLANTRSLGVMLITSYIMDPKIAIENDHAPFYEVLELDVRGRPTSYLDMKIVSIEIGEIKLTVKNLRHGYRQLLIRLATLGFTIEALNSKGDEVADYRCELVGILYVPKVPSIIDIPKEWEHGIKFPKGANHIIRVVAVGDKP